MSKVTQNNGKTRTYTVVKEDGTELNLASVTSILQVVAKPALLPWVKKMMGEYILDHANDIRRASSKEEIAAIVDEAKRQDLAVRDAAADIGSLAHAEVERVCRKLMSVDQANPAVAHMVRAFDEWAKSVNLEVIRNEDTVYSELGGFAGTLDILARVNGEVCVVDIKTSSGIYPEMIMQVAAYREAWNEMADAVAGDPLKEVPKATSGWIVKLAKKEDDPKPFEVKHITSDEMDAAYEGFNAAAILNSYLQGQKPPAKPRKSSKKVAK